MSAISSVFDTKEPSLQEVLSEIDKGAYQLPDFQRGWVWNDEHIRELLTSVSLSFPIGAIMLLECGGNTVKFRPKLFEGVNLNSAIAQPEKLIIDGQQRLTALYYALKSLEVVPTKDSKGKEIERFYYFNMQKCLVNENDRIEAIESVPKDRVIRTDFGREIKLDLSSPEKEYQECYYPLQNIFNQDKANIWLMEYSQFHGHNKEKLELYFNFQKEIISRFQQYRIPIIELLKDTKKEAVCLVFEKVNTGGVVLTVFELVTATFAADDFQLRADWEERESRLEKYDQLYEIDPTMFLTAVTLLTSYQKHLSKNTAVSCKKKDVLELNLEDYKNNADSIEKSLISAAKFLTREKIFDSRDVPYQTQFIPLSVICALLEKRFEEDPIKQKMRQWYWCGVFGELYGGTTDTRFALDVVDFMQWIKNGDEPRTVRDANFSPLRLLSLQSRISAAYKGIMALLMQVGSLDFLSGDTLEINNYFDLLIDIHHIFPVDYCKKKNYERSVWNSIINKTPISARSNKILEGNAPSVYLDRLERRYDLSEKRLTQILKSHLINIDFLYEDSFDQFIKDRAKKLLDLIEEAMNKSIYGRDSEEVISVFGAEV